MIFKSSEDVHQEKHIENATDQENDRADYVYLRTTLLDVVLGSSEFCLLTRLANIIVSHLDVPLPVVCTLIIDGWLGFMFFKYVT